MDSRMLVLGAIACALSLATLLLSVRSHKSSHSVAGERRIVAYGDNLKLLVVAFGMLVPVAVLFFYSDNRLDFGASLLILGFDTFVVGYCGPEFFRTRIEFDEKFAYAYSAWRKPRVIPWTVIMDFKHSRLKHWSVFDTFGHGSLRVSDFMNGADDFMAKFKQYGEDSIEYREAHPAT
jgi:hypothetical protein